MGKRASTASRSWPEATRPSFATSVFPAIPTTRHSRYIEAEVEGPRRRLDLSAQRQSGRDREIRLQAALDGSPARPCRPVAGERTAAVLCGDWNVIPEDRDVFSVRATQHDALMQPEARQPVAASSIRAGPTRCARSIPKRTSSTPSGITPPAAGSAISASASIICCARPKQPTGCSGAGVDKWARGEEKASDHAPTWIELG